MRRRSPNRRSPTHVLAFGLFATLVASRLSPPASAASLASPERWIVLFRDRSFDLHAYRAAIRAHRPDAEIKAIVADLDRRAADDQQPFVTQVAELGGRVLHHWWIINGCAVELPADRALALPTLPGVLRADREAAPRPGGEPTGTADHTRSAPAPAAIERDHGAATARAFGVDGAGQTLAILDTGQDADCNGSGRPHPLYFAATAGTGIAGSRLVRNAQMGRMPADDRIGHGTAVAAIAAGAPWNAPGAAAGHAPAADIAGYAIAERADGASADITLINAWQQVARDRARLPLVGANNSYCGSPDPTAPVQQALDSAAYHADLLVTVCAYNTGLAGTAQSQSACNGLAVGAVTAGDHTVCDYSARGPLHGDAQRTYPDLCAVANAIGPNPDCEHTAGPWFGTSFASPQVLGAAALVRQAAPQASALVTKAILLASTFDVETGSGGRGRNAVGTGLLRDDCAVATALDATRHGERELAPGAPLRIPFAVRRGEPCAIAIAWHRTDFASAQWPDVDLRIVDGDTVVATGSSRRNLYEHARFTPQHDGIVVAELVPVDLPRGSVEVAFAIAHLPAVPVAATYRAIGTACRGDLAPAVLQSSNGDATPADLQRDVQQLSATEWLFEFTAPPGGLRIGGFEALLGLGDGPAIVDTALYLAAGDGPRGEPAARGRMQVGRQPGWIATRLASAVRVRGGDRYWLALAAHSACRFTIALRDGTPVHASYRWPCSGAFVDGGRAAAGFRVLGTTAGVDEPQLSNLDVPDLGHTFTVEVAQVAPRSPLLVATAFAEPAAALDLDLGWLGVPRCIGRLSLDGLTAVLADGGGTALVPLAIPAAPQLRGAVFCQQAFAVAVRGTGTALVATHQGRGYLGDAR